MVLTTRNRFEHLLLVGLLGLIPELAHAEWLEVMANIETGQTVYVDQDAIHRNGDLVEIWTMYDYKTSQRAGQDEYMSRKVQNEFNCTQEVRRMLSVTEYSGNMGNGKVVYEKPSLLSTEPRWTRVQPGIAETLMKIACGKK
jgi:hypothetical protein